MRSKIVKLLVVLLLPMAMCLESLQAEQIRSLGDAIDQAGRQRMLSQRIVKAYCQILLNADAYAANEQLKTASDLFQIQLDNLNAYATTAKVKAGLQEVEVIWGPFQRVANNQANRGGLIRLAELSESLLIKSHQVVLALEALSRTPAGHLTNLAGRQRMLSQRIAKFYLLRALGDRTEETQAGIVKAAEEFRVALDKLRATPQNTAMIKNDLATISDDWSVVEDYLSEAEKNSFSPMSIGIYTDRLLSRMNRVTGMYARIGNE